MRNLRLPLMLTGVLLTTACATATRQEAAGRNWIDESRDGRLHALAQAKQEIDSLLREGRAPADVEAADAVVLIGRDTVRGRGALRHALVTVSDGRTPVGAQLYPREIDHCTDGLHERDGTLVALVSRGDGLPPDTVTPRYAARWMAGSAGLELVAMHLDMRQGVNGAMRITGVPCTPVHLAQYAQHRWRISTAMTTPGLIMNRLPVQMERTLAEHGWGDGRLYTSGGGVTLLGYEGSRSETPFAGVEATYTARAPWTVGLHAAAVPERIRVQGYNRSAESHVTIEMSRWNGGALVGYQSPRLRVAVGPELAIGSMDVTHEGWSTATHHDGSTWYVRTTPKVTAKGTPAALGWRAQAGVVHPMSSRFAVEVRGQAYTTPARVPAVGELPAMTAAGPITMIGVALHWAN